MRIASGLAAIPNVIGLWVLRRAAADFLLLAFLLHRYGPQARITKNGWGLVGLTIGARSYL